MRTTKSKLILFALVSLAVLFFYFSGASEYLQFESIQLNLEKMKVFRQQQPIATVLIFMSAYILITSLSIPGSIVLTLLSGALFGVALGTLIVTVSCTTGAVIAFLMSRYLFKEFVLRHFGEKFKRLDSKFRNHGKSYLFTLRLIPVSPFVVVNLLMALTSIKLKTYAWITYVAMFPGTFIYVLAGLKFSEISSPSEILTWPIIILILLGTLPFILKGIVTFWRSHTYKVQ